MDSTLARKMNMISEGYSSTCKAICAESELQQFLVCGNDDDPVVVQKKFRDFKTKLTSLTKMTGNYFNRLVSALEGGLSEFS